MKIKIECKTDEEREAAKHFLVWLCEQGEQDYWTWMEYREGENAGDITMLRLKYDFKKFTVEPELGRLDRKE